MSKKFSLLLDQTIVFSFISLENRDFLSKRVLVFKNCQDHVNVKTCLDGVDISRDKVLELAKLIFQASTLAFVSLRLIMIALLIKIIDHLSFWVSSNFKDVDVFHLFYEVWNINFI